MKVYENLWKFSVHIFKHLPNRKHRISLKLAAGSHRAMNVNSKNSESYSNPRVVTTNRAIKSPYSVYH